MRCILSAMRHLSFRQYGAAALVLVACGAPPAGRTPSPTKMAQFGQNYANRDLVRAADLGDTKDMLRLLELGADPNAQVARADLFPVPLSSEVLAMAEMASFRGTTSAPEAAVEKGQASALVLLYEHGATPGPRALVMLRMAATKNDVAVAKILLGHGADPLAMKDGPSALQTAAESRSADVVVLFASWLRAKNVPNIEAPLRSALGLALSEELSKAIRYREGTDIRAILDKGADPNVADLEGLLPLTRAVIPPARFESVRVLVERGANVDRADAVMGAPLRNVEDPEIAKFLLAHSADIHALAEDGSAVYDIPKSPALAALWEEELRKHPLDPAKRMAQERALIALVKDPAKLTKNFHSAAGRGQIPILQILVDRQAPVDFDLELYSAAENSTLEVAKFLVAHGANVNRKDWAPIAAASCTGKVDIVQWLLQSGASPNGTDLSSYHLHALSCAATMGHAAVVKLLLAAGADPTVKDRGDTPLEAAKSQGHQAVVEILRNWKPPRTK